MVSEGMVLTDKEAKTFDGLASLEMLLFNFFEIFFVFEFIIKIIIHKEIF